MIKKNWVFLFGFVLSATLTNAQKVDSVKIEQLIAQMTLDEKINMIHAVSSFNSGGVPRLHIPEITTSDGPHGVRVEHGRGWSELKNVYDSGTYLPVGVCLASTWNRDLGYQFGKVLGSEANYRGKDIILGPGVNIMRSPLNGRNFEYQSEDPYLAGQMAVGYIKGVQSEGVSACVKHFLGNNQETLRGSINVLMSERALREIYLPAFKMAVQQGSVNAVMASYNKFRGEWSAENNYLLEQILRKELSFKGVVMSDWGAVHHTMEAVWNGMDMEMGSDIGNPPLAYNKFYLGDTIKSLIDAHRLSEYYIDAKVRRLLTLMAKTGMLDHSRKQGDYNTPEHQQVAEKVAEEGIVLLKNEQLLPLSSSKIKSILVVGENAVRKNSMGGGSSQVKAFYEITPLEGLKKLVNPTVKITYLPGYEIRKDAHYDPQLANQVKEAAKQADIVLFVGGTIHGFNYSIWSDNAYDTEGDDKPDMKLPFGQDSLINDINRSNPNTVVVLLGGGPVDMSAWVDKAKSILEAWYPGMNGGNALAKILLGQVNPSGKLPVSFPKKLEDVPAHKLGEYPGDGVNVTYYDDIYVGYRYYDTYKVQPRFAFGHGLSYTTFEYSNIKMEKKSDGKIIVHFSVANKGKMAGAETAQLYVHQEKSKLPRPEKELKGFEKVFLQPGQKKELAILLDESAFSYFDDIKNSWVKDGGAYDILVGGASDQIALQCKVNL